MIIRPIKKSEVKEAAIIAGLNWEREDMKIASREINAMFESKVIPPKYLVAEEKNKVIGLAGYSQSWIDYQIYNIFWVNVHPSHQGKGIGSKLILNAIKEIKKNKGDNKARLIILSTNKPKFYTRFGFKILSNPYDKYFLMGLKLK